MIKLADHKR